MIRTVESDLRPANIGLGSAFCNSTGNDVSRNGRVAEPQ